MIIKLGNGKEIVLDDITKDPKAEAIAWLKKRKEENMKPKIEEMTAAQCYDELDRLHTYKQVYGRGHSPDAAQARHYCSTMRAEVKRRLKELKAPATRPGDSRVYGPGAAAWQRAGGKL